MDHDDDINGPEYNIVVSLSASPSLSPEKLEREGLD